MARRSPWMDQKADLLVRILADRHGMPLDEAAARDDISDQVDVFADRLRIGRQAAKRYVTDEWISEFADHVARAVIKLSRPHGAAGLRRVW